MNDLIAIVDVVRHARETTAELARQLHILQEQFEYDHRALIEALAQAREAQQEAEQLLRQKGVDHYLADMSAGKQLAPGVSIREKIELDYNAAVAFEWAKEKNQLAITPACLNVEAFEKLARQFPAAVPFVKQCKTYQVILARQL